MTNEKVRVSDLFLAKQREMLERLLGARRVVAHPGEKGTATEENWRELLSAYLPNRYEVDKAFVVDVDGQRSQQIDVIVFDQQYSPVLFETGGVRFIPAENVYAVFEVKQELDRRNLDYAARKVESVRRLRRTSAPIVHAGGEYEPRAPFRILGGILATASAWSRPFDKPLTEALKVLPAEGRVDIGCMLEQGAFEATYAEGIEVRVDVDLADVSLVSFLFKLLRALQRMGTVPAIDFEEWLKWVR